MGFVKIKTDFHLCHSEGALATEESYSTDLLHEECFLPETGAVRSFASLRMTGWGVFRMTAEQRISGMNVGRVLAPAVDGRNYRNRTACRQDASVIGTHLHTSAYLLRYPLQICQHGTAGASTRPTPYMESFYSLRSPPHLLLSNDSILCNADDRELHALQVAPTVQLCYT